MLLAIVSSLKTVDKTEEYNSPIHSFHLKRPYTYKKITFPAVRCVARGVRENISTLHRETASSSPSSTSSNTNEFTREKGSKKNHENYTSLDISNITGANYCLIYDLGMKRED